MNTRKLQVMPDSSAPGRAKPAEDTHETAATTATVASVIPIAEVKRRRGALHAYRSPHDAA
jgi:hypothetical protein